MQNPGFNGLLRAGETVETVGSVVQAPYTPLKRGVNEIRTRPALRW